LRLDCCLLVKLGKIVLHFGQSLVTEAEYYSGYTLPNPDGVAFVLPNQPRTGTPAPGQTLLETAKLLMACTPNGI
jgi:hypothetical protein